MTAMLASAYPELIDLVEEMGSLFVHYIAAMMSLVEVIGAMSNVTATAVGWSQRWAVGRPRAVLS